MELVADRFVGNGDGTAIDLATGDRIELTITSAGGETEQRRWTLACDALQKVHHPTVARLIDYGVCIGIKYAVVRDDPSQDKYLHSLLRRVDRSKVISGIGERPAICHLRDFQLTGFTTGSGCLAPRLSNDIFDACRRGAFDTAGPLRAEFLPLEDLRDAWGPSKVLHFATALAGLADTGPILPYFSPLSAAQLEQLAHVSKTLVERNAVTCAA